MAERGRPDRSLSEAFANLRVIYKLGRTSPESSDDRIPVRMRTEQVVNLRAAPCRGDLSPCFSRIIFHRHGFAGPDSTGTPARVRAQESGTLRGQFASVSLACRSPNREVTTTADFAGLQALVATMPPSKAPRIPPSRHRRQTSEDLAKTPDFPDGEDKAAPSGGRISPTALTRASYCLLRGLLSVRGEKGLDPSPFAQDSMKDGNAYERALLEKNNRVIWIRAINQAMNLELPDDLPVREAKRLRQTDDEARASFMERVQGHLEKLVADRSTPFAIHEVVLTSGTESGARLQGQPDLLIWTGDHWLLADIKCSEQARRSHGIQIAAYDRMLAAMLPQDRRSEKGCVIHCATGFRFTAASGPTTQADRLRHTQATAFPIELLEPTLDELLALLGDTSDDAVRRAEKAAVFSSACNECAYRIDCFQRFAQERHVSLLPFAKAQLKVLSDAEVRTIDQVREAIDPSNSSLHKRLLELFENSELHLSFLKQKIEMVARCGCYSAWMPAPSGSHQPLFFTSVGEDVCFDPDPSRPFNPTSLVVYTEAERCRAWVQMLEMKKDWPYPLRQHVLSEEIQEKVHGLMPSLTLKPLADYLDWTRRAGSLADFVGWFKAGYADNTSGQLVEPATASERMILLKKAYHFLEESQPRFDIV